MRANDAQILEPLVSIIIPVYNVQEYAISCIESVINQTYKNLEVLIIDDGSTDETISLVQESIGLDHRFTIIRKENGGLSSARNVGTDYSSGDYIMYVDGDDLIDSCAVEEMVRAAIKFDVQFVAASFSKTPPLENYKTTRKTDFRLESGRERFKHLLLFNGESGSACGKLFHRSLISWLRFPEGQYFEDLGVIAGVCAHVDRMAFSETPYYAYVTRPGSITTLRRQGSKHVHDMEQAIAVVRRLSEAEGFFDEFACFQAICTLRVAMRVDPDAFDDTSVCAAYLRYARDLAANSSRSPLMSKTWRLRCALFAVSPRVHNAFYAIYGSLSGKAVG